MATQITNRSIAALATLLVTTFPTATAAVKVLEDLGIVVEVTFANSLSKAVVNSLRRSTAH